MELKMGCFVMIQSILFHLGCACLLACFHQAPKQQILLLCQVPKVKAVSALGKEPVGSNNVEVLACCKDESLNLTCSVNSALMPV